MRPEEEYVLKALAAKFGGEFTDGDNPPDAYLVIEGTRIAVEVTRLIQHTINEDGILRPRPSDDVPATMLANNLDRDLKTQIPDGLYFFLIIPTPVNDVRNTKRELTSIILDMVNTKSMDADVQIRANSIHIKVYEGERPSGKKVVAALPNRNSSADIGLNTRFLLQDRITTKNKKRQMDGEFDEYWLALLNEYWIADERSYQVAYDALQIEHGFDKIYLINGDSRVHQLC